MLPGKAKWYHIMKGFHKLMKTRFNRIENMRIESTPRNKNAHHIMTNAQHIILQALIIMKFAHS